MTDGCFSEDEALAFASNALDPGAASAVERHADGCDACRELLSEIARDKAEQTLEGDELESGSKIGRYVILRPLGAGAMGEVFAAFDPELDRQVALKLLRLELGEVPQARSRLRTEAKLLARLSHPNVTTVHDVGFHGDQLFVALELVDGTTLRGWLHARPRSLREILPIFVQAGRGLAAAHAANLVHRDFKPDNVLVGKDGRVRVTDFGLAGLAPPAAPASETPSSVGAAPATGASPGSGAKDLTTQSGTLVGTPAYMAPEQRARSDADHLSDQYGFCATLYEAIFGRLPAVDAAAEVPALDARGERIPGWLRQILQRGLSRDRRARYPSMQALLADLDRGRPADRRLVAGLALAAIIIAAPLSIRAIRDRRNPCAAVERRLASVWDGSRRASLRAAFDATKKRGAAEAFARISAALDAFAANWSRRYQTACEASLVETGAPLEVKQAQLACLGHQLEELGALTEVLSLRAGSDFAQLATTADRLSEPGRCPEARVAGVTAPSAAESARAEGLRTRLAKGRALFDAGQIADATAAAKAVVDQAHAAKSSAVEAEALLLLGLLTASGNLGEQTAEGYFFDAATTAESAHADVTAAQAWIRLLRGLSGPAPDGKRVAEVARLAEAAVLRMGNPPELRVLLGDAAASAAFHTADYALARAQAQAALAVARSSFGSDNAATISIHLTLAKVEEKTGHLDAALAEAKLGLEIFSNANGSLHPYAAPLHISIAVILWRLGRLEESVQETRTAVEIGSAAYGPTNKELLTPLGNMAATLIALKRYGEAEKELRRVLDITEQNYGPRNSNAIVPLLNYTELLIIQKRYADALKTAESAMEIAEQTYGKEHEGMIAPLSAVGRALVGTGANRRAIPLVERALRLSSAPVFSDASSDPGETTGDLKFALAEAVAATHGSTARAIRLAREARALWIKAPECTDKVARADRWLALATSSGPGCGLRRPSVRSR